MKLSVVVPCFNEEQNIDALVDAFAGTELEKDSLELILVDNGSVDGTRKKIYGACSRYSWIKLVIVEKNLGYGYGIKCGMGHSSGEFIGWIHADLQTPPASFEKALAVMNRTDRPESCYYKGLRRNRPFLDRLFTTGMSFYETLYLKTFLYDINGQPSIISRKMYEKMTHIPDDFSLDLYVYYFARKNGYEVKRFGVKQRKRLAGESSWNKGFLSRMKGAFWVMGWSKNIRKNGV